MRRWLPGLLVALLLLGGCNPANRAQEWAETAVSQNWQAKYRLVFHQKDADLEMLVRESRGETLVLDIQMSRGTLRLEYDGDALLVDLDEGDLQWQDVPRQVPYYTLSEIARLLAAAPELTLQGEWVEHQGYRLKVKKGLPLEAELAPEWSLYVEEFIWH